MANLTVPIIIASPSRLPSFVSSTKNATTRKIFCSVCSDTRRSSNYAPTCWDNNFVLSLGTHNSHTDVYSTRQFDDMREFVRHMINDVTAALEKLELIDTIQRLGLKYQFEGEIRRALDSIYQDSEDSWFSNDLHAASLRFRLLRQNKYKVHEDVFDRFKDETGNFRASLCGNINGLLSMYEASFLGLEDEPIIDEAKDFATAKLKEIMAGGDNISPSLARKVGHALEMPLHWRVTRIDARWFIETYEQEQNMDPSLLEMAKMDYNMVQSIYQKEVAELVRWWMDTGLGEIKFVRDRPVESYFWSSGIMSEPSFGDYRAMGAKVNCLITTIDDVYDIYGTLNELELLTDFVDRWDISGIDKLPLDMRKCFLVLFNTSHDIGYWILKEHGLNIIPYLRKGWADMCKAFLQEAKWNHGEQTPTLQEYLENALVSVGVPVVLLCVYLLTTDKISVEALEYIEKFPRVIRCSSLIMRLTNDLASFTIEVARGENLQVLQYHMNETGASEEETREYFNNMVSDTWKTLNSCSEEYHPFSEIFLSAIPNLARIAQCVYQNGDGHSEPHTSTKDHLISLLVEPLPLNIAGSINNYGVPMKL